jgi:hypothetical protein
MLHRLSTIKIRHEWDLAVDSKENVFAVYVVPGVGWRLRIRSPGPQGTWSDSIDLPADSYGYRLAPDKTGKVHLIYARNGTAWHNWLLSK